MSQTTFVTRSTVHDRPAEVPLLALLDALAALNVSFQRKADDLALKNGGVLTDELRAALAEHKAALLSVADLRAGLTRLFEYAVRLRCEDPPKGSRAQALTYQAQQIDKLSALSVSVGGTAEGWPDPADPYADMDQLTMLREDLSELTRENAPYPVPLPAGAVLLPEANFDPFAHGRNYAGRVIGEAPQK